MNKDALSVMASFEVLNLKECCRKADATDFAATTGGVEQLDVSAEGINYDDNMREPHVRWEWTYSINRYSCHKCQPAIDTTNRNTFITACNAIIS